MTDPDSLQRFLIATALDAELRQRFEVDPAAVAGGLSLDAADLEDLLAGGERALGVLGRAVEAEVGGAWRAAGGPAPDRGAGPVLLELPEVRYELVIRPHAVQHPSGQIHLSFSTSVRPLGVALSAPTVQPPAERPEVLAAAAAVHAADPGARTDRLLDLAELLEG
ncbi:MAG: hypothetical protein JXX28_03760 [Deltaproteobacteria bacterium]|nr:hypothetical protein [Deltaproteobacteria bacterium]